MRGIEAHQEHSARKVARDTRPLGIRSAEFISRPNTLVVIAGAGAVISLIYPMAVDALLLVGGCVFWFGLSRKVKLPFRMPRTAGIKDHNDLIPGTTTARMANGISFFGNDRKTGEELWFTNDDLRTHILIFGSTGSGKTEALISIAFNSLLHGSGFIYVDGKGDNSLYAKIFSMVRSMGREDDLLLINFMTGARDVLGAQKNRLSNTMNPFANGSSSMLAQLITSLMDDSKAGQGGDMWKGRAINFVESLMRVLVPMRDAGNILLDANSIRNFFMLEKLEQMVVDKEFPLENGGIVSLKGYPPQVLEPLTSYIMNLPGYSKSNKFEQENGVREQHGFITMQLTRIMSSLADTYGHIIRTNLAEVEFKDVVLNRRILVVLLPALEKSPDELSNLGKIIIASLKAMMASGLGDAVEGDYRDLILRKPTNSPTPYVCIMDEYGYYAVQGFAVVPAQARSLGFSTVFAGQDLPAFQKASKEEAASICANTNVKICMKLEDPQETWEFFNKVAGEAYVTNVSGFQMQSNSLSINYLDTRNASIDRRQRIELLDLKDQREGEAHIFFKSTIVRAEMFYANPPPAKTMRLNHYLKVQPPSADMLVSLNKRLDKFAEILADPEFVMPLPEVSADNTIEIISNSLDNLTDLKPFERGIAVLISLLEYEVERQKEISAPYESDVPTDDMSVFTKVPMSKLIRQMIGDENVDLFTLPLLRRGSTMEELKHIERLAGRSSSVSEGMAASLIRDIENATQFPPEVEFTQDADRIGRDIDDLIELLGGDLDDADKYTIDSNSENALDYEVQDDDENDGDTGGDISELELPDLDLSSLAELPELPELAELEKLLAENKEGDDDDEELEEYDETQDIDLDEDDEEEE